MYDYTRLIWRWCDLIFCIWFVRVYACDYVYIDDRLLMMCYNMWQISHTCHQHFLGRLILFFAILEQYKYKLNAMNYLYICTM